MKNLKKLFNLSVILLTLLCVLNSCKHEEDELILKTINNKITLLHKQQNFVLKEASLMRIIDNMQNKELLSKGTNSKIKIFTERTTYTLSKQTNEESYSFYIQRGIYDKNYIENLVLKRIKNHTNFKAYIITYYFPKGINSKKEVFEITNVEPIRIEDIEGMLQRCENTYEYTVVETEHKCYSGEHQGISGQGKCDYETTGNAGPYSTWSIQVTVNYQCDGGGSFGGGTSSPIDSGSPSETDNTSPDNPDTVIDTGITLPPNCQEDNCPNTIVANDINTILGDTLNEQELLWLFNNETEANQIKDFLNENNNSEEAKLASSITIATLVTNSIEGPYGNSYFEIINSKLNTNLTDPYLQAVWITHFSIKCAILKKEHPNWSNFKIYWEASREMVHFALDMGGLVPVVGEIFDITNGIIYTIEGDGVNASMSFASAIPVVGWFSAGGKYAYKLAQHTINGTRVKLVMEVLSNGFVYFGSSGSKLRKALGITDAAMHAHHLIPWAMKNHDLVQKAAKSKHAFHLNEALNGIPRLNNLHLTGHKIYNTKILNILEEYKNRINTPDEAYNFITGLANHIRALIKNNPTLNSGQIADLIRYP